MDNKTIISVIIPCRNEENFIAKCIENVLDFKLPENCITEILIIDGMSDDKTPAIVESYITKNTNIYLLKNEGVYQAVALNIGIKKATGKYVLRLDAHSEYPSEYLYLLYQTAIRTDADNTGGLVITKPFDDTYQAAIVQALTTHVFGVGNSGFRTGMKEGKTDTVPYGFFKKNIFSEIGYFDERLIRAQDYEFNKRIIRKGGKIWINPAIQLCYYNQKNIFRFLKKQFLLEAPYNAYMWYLAPYTFAYRHAITGIFTLGIFSGILLSFFSPFIAYLFLSIISLYFFLSIASSVQQAIRFKKPAHIFVLPFCFFSYHFIHGLGVLNGLLMLLFKTAPIFIRPKKK